MMESFLLEFLKKKNICLLAVGGVIFYGFSGAQMTFLLIKAHKWKSYVKSWIETEEKVKVFLVDNINNGNTKRVLRRDCWLIMTLILASAMGEHIFFHIKLFRDDVEVREKLRENKTSIGEGIILLTRNSF